MNVSHILYPACKYSGLPWLGDVPEHWDVRRLKHAVQINPETLSEDTDLEYLFNYMDINSVGTGYMSTPPVRQVFGNAPSRARRVMRTGDTAISTVRTYLKAAYHLQRDWPDLIASTGFAILRPPVGIVPALLGHFVRSDAFVRQVVANSVGIAYPAISETKLGTLCLPLPPLSEQRTIVHYLDYVDRRIRRYISAKQKLVDLLEEEKQAIINQAVTRGLDPDVRLKPSGVEWLGDVPEHWEVLPVKRAFLSRDYGISESASDSGAIRLLTMGHLKDGQVIVPNDGGVDFVAPHLLLQKGDLLFNRTNSQELVGKVGLFIGHDTAVTFASYLVRMRPYPSHEPEYLNMALNDASFISRARREAIPSLHQSNLNPTRFGRIHIALPSKEEQVAILSTLREETESLGAAIAAARRQIELLEEYRTRLIADVVTGKLDVREVAAQLVDQTDDQDPIEGDGLLTEGMDRDLFDADASGEELAMESEVTV